MCKFYSGFGGVRNADSRIYFVLPDRKLPRESATKTYTNRCAPFKLTKNEQFYN